MSPRRAGARERLARDVEAALVAVCRSEPDPAGLAALARLEWPEARRALLDLAARHHVVGRAMWALERVPAADRGTAAEEKRWRQTLRWRSAVFSLKRDRVCAVLQEAGLSAVVLKGGVLADTVYDDPAQRDLEDLDVLVAPDRVHDAFRALANVGYGAPYPAGHLRSYLKRHFHLPMRDEGGHYVEIHWDLSPPASPFGLDAAALMAAAVVWRRRGEGTIVGPDPAHALLHVVVQNLQERFTRIARLVDIDRLLRAGPPIDPERVIQSARGGRLGAATALSLQLAGRLLGTRIDPAWVRDLQPSRPARFHLAAMRPAGALLRAPASRILSAKKLLEFWLLPAGVERVRLLPSVLRDEAIGERARSRWPFGRVIRLAKLILFQGFLYVAAALALTTHEGRDQMRFWSSHARSSERL